jgi:hypothetical protein
VPVPAVLTRSIFDKGVVHVFKGDFLLLVDFRSTLLLPLAIQFRHDAVQRDLSSYLLSCLFVGSHSTPYLDLLPGLVFVRHTDVYFENALILLYSYFGPDNAVEILTQITEYGHFIVFAFEVHDLFLIHLLINNLIFTRLCESTFKSFVFPILVELIL